MFITRLSGISFSTSRKSAYASDETKQATITMNGLSPNATMALIGPGVLAVFGIAFVCAWAIEKKRHYLLQLALACILFGLATCSQILAFPNGTYPNAVVSGLLYTSAVVAAAEGILRRAERQLGIKADLAIIAVVTTLICYYAYVTPLLLARVYIQNFGYGAIFFAAAIRLIPTSGTRPVDRALFWILLVFSLQFFPRTVLTIGAVAPADAKAFAASSFWQVLQLSLAVFGAALAFAILGATIADILDDMRRERDSDSLTGLLNRRGFEDRARPHFVQAKSSLALVLCDLDHFKSINDAYGHSTGDEVLKAFGAILRDELRAGDLAGRLGGEEFAVLLPGASITEAAGFAERVRSALVRRRFDCIPASRRITASFGVEEWHRGNQFKDLYERADQRLYLAKSGGRNRVVTTDLADTPGLHHSLSPSSSAATGEIAWLDDRSGRLHPARDHAAD